MVGFRCFARVVAVLGVALAAGCMANNKPNPFGAAVGSEVSVSPAQVRQAVEKWLEQAQVQIVAKRVGNVDGEVAFRSERGLTTIVRYEPSKEGMTFLQVLQPRDGQPEASPSEDYVSGIQHQIARLAAQLPSTSASAR